MRVVVGIDGSRSSAAALRWAADEARARGCPLLAVHAIAARSVHGVRGYDAILQGQIGRAAEAVLTRVLAEQSDAVAGLEVARRVLVDPSPGRALLDAAAQGGLLVIGARGTGGFRNLLIGSMCDQAARHAACPLVVVPVDWERGAPQRLIAGVDGSAGSLGALAWACEEAALHAAALEVVHAYLPYTAGRPFGAEFMEAAAPGCERRLQAAAQEVLDEALAEVGAPPAAQRRVLPGAPASALVEASRAADLLVLGARGREGFSGLLLGSVARQALQQAACPVAIIRTAHPPLS